MEGVQDPCVIWLDGHYSGQGTARGTEDSPVEKELSLLLARKAGRDSVLVDDARLFTGNGGYPTVEELTNQVLAARPKANIEIKGDIIQIWDV